MNLSSISRLLQPSRPSAIARLIIPIVVWESINRMRQTRSTAHVQEKRLKIVPSFTDSNTTTSVIFPRLMFWISASFSHCRPTFISNRYFSSRRCSVEKMISLLISACNGLFEPIFRLKTTTASYGMSSVFSCEVIAHDYFLFSAITQTFPTWPSFANFRSSSQNEKPVKSLSSSINKRGSHVEVPHF